MQIGKGKGLRTKAQILTLEPGWKRMAAGTTKDKEHVKSTNRERADLEVQTEIAACEQERRSN